MKNSYANLSHEPKKKPNRNRIKSNPPQQPVEGEDEDQENEQKDERERL